MRNFDGEFEDFWKNVRSHFHICVERDSNYLRWRYGKPEEEYKILKIAHQGIMVGYAVLKTETRFNLKTGYIMDFIVCPKDDYIHELLSAIVMDFQKEKVDLISALLMKKNPYHRIFRKYGFLSIPRRFQPQEIHFGGRHRSTLKTDGNYSSWILRTAFRRQKFSTPADFLASSGSELLLSIPLNSKIPAISSTHPLTFR